MGNGFESSPWSEELDGKKLYVALGGECDLEPRVPAASHTSSTRSQPAFSHLQVWYYTDFKGVVF